MGRVTTSLLGLVGIIHGMPHKFIEVYSKSMPANDHKSVSTLRMWPLEIMPDINGLTNVGFNKFQQGFSVVRVYYLL